MSNQAPFRYKSKLGATRLIAPEHYLAEFILLRHAAAKKYHLPDRIWNKARFAHSLEHKYWYGLYWGEHKRATEWLKLFSVNIILDALQTDEGKVILSLTNPKLKRLLPEAQRRHDLKEATREKIDLEVVPTNTVTRTKLGTKSKLGKLK